MKTNETPEKNLKKIFSKDIIKDLRLNKEKITEDLLKTLRSNGNEGKQIALDILDIEKDQEQYYLDAFKNKISFMGNRRLKKSFVKLNLSEIHIKEIEKCALDIDYFKDNYVKIKTKNGVNFPDLRTYQSDYIAALDDDENPDIIGLMGRQSGKSVSTGIYLAHLYNFKRDLSMGIVANRGSTAGEILNTVKNIIISIPVWMQQGTEIWNKRSIENESQMRILTDVPTADAFTGFTMSVLVVDEAAKIKKSAWDDFSDSIFPSQSGLSWKKNIIISTAYGMNHYYDLVEGARHGTNGMSIFEVNWRDVPRYDELGNLLTPEEFQKKVVDKYGVLHFNQNYANEFMGSSHTLISTGVLSKMKAGEIEEKRDGKLKIYKYPQEKHQYIMSVDPAKDGTDAFAVQILDITEFKFEQVATAQLQIDYLLMPEFIDEWGRMYNTAYLVIENNEGAGQSIADQMYQSYEYENLHFDKGVGKYDKRKKYPGFRTTVKTRKQILQTLKLFIENSNLKIVDKKTINEFYQFILIKNKFQADDGATDDLIMALAIAFAPFCNIKNFEDMKLIVAGLYNDDSDDEDKMKFTEHLTIGSFDDFTDESILNYETENNYETMEEAMENSGGFV